MIGKRTNDWSKERTSTICCTVLTIKRHVSRSRSSFFLIPASLKIFFHSSGMCSICMRSDMSSTLATYTNTTNGRGMWSKQGQYIGQLLTRPKAKETYVKSTLVVEADMSTMRETGRACAHAIS